MKKNLVKTQEQKHWFSWGRRQKTQIIGFEEENSWKLKFKNQIAILHLISKYFLAMHFYKVKIVIKLTANLDLSST